MKVVGYTCIDHFAQQPKNLSLSHQADRIKDFVRERRWELVDIVEEEIHSGSGSRQDKLGTLLGRANEGEYNFLVVARLDRLTRNIRQLNKIVSNTLEANGVGLISLEEELDSTSESGASSDS